MATPKKYEFDIAVAADALYTPNAREFYTKAFIETSSLTAFRKLMNIKEKTKIGNLTFTDPVQAANCEFVATDSDLNAKEMEPCKLSIMTEMCQFDLESSFISESMAAGSNGPFVPADFASHYYDQLGLQTGESLEYLVWQGDTTSGSGSLALCDGMFKKFYDDGTIPAAQDIAGISITASNVVAEMTKVYQAIPSALKRKKNQLIWFVSSNVADAYALAVAQASAEQYTTKSEDLRFVGIQLVVGEGMFDDTMCLSINTNYIFLTDLMNDWSTINTIDLKQTTGAAKVRTRSDFKFGVDFLNPEEWVVYGNPIVA